MVVLLYAMNSRSPTEKDEQKTVASRTIRHIPELAFPVVQDFGGGILVEGWV